MTHSIASDNKVVGVGGAILAGSGSSVIVRDSELSGNAVKHGAAAIDTYGDLLVIERSIIRDNGNGYGYGGDCRQRQREYHFPEYNIWK